MAIDRTIKFTVSDLQISHRGRRARMASVIVFYTIRYSLVATCVPHYCRYEDNRSRSNVQIAVCACIFHYGIAKPGDSRGKPLFIRLLFRGIM